MVNNQDKQPRTIRQELEAITKFRPTVSSGSLSSYVSASPSHIERDRFAGSGWGQVGQALREFSPTLDKYMSNMMDRQQEEDKATASMFAAENPELTTDMETFRQAALSDERLLNVSPHVKRYIEQEIMQGNAIQLQAELEDKYSTSDIRNEKDPAKVFAWGEQVRKDFMQAKGLENHPDRMGMARFFNHPSKRILEGIMSRHSREVESQNATLLEQQKFQNITDALAISRNLTNPVGGNLDTKIPADRLTYTQKAAQVIMGEVEDMKALGYSQARIMDFMGRVVTQGNHNARTARQLAESLSVEVNGQKVSLMSQPGVAKALDQMGEAEIDKAWKAETRAHTRKTWAREDSAHKAVNSGYEYGSKGNADLSRETVVNKLGLCSAEDYPRFKAAAEDGQKGQFKSMYANPAMTAAALSLESDLKQGKAGKAEVMELAREGYDPAQVQRLLSLADANTTAEGQAILTAQSNIAKTYISLVGNVSAEEATAAYDSYKNGGSAKPAAGILAQVMQDLPAVNTAFADFVEEKRREQQEKAGPNQKDVPLSSLSMQRLVQEFQGTFLDKKIKETKERYGAEKIQRTDNKAVQSYLMNPKTVGVINGDGNDGSLFKRPDPSRIAVFNGAVSNMNTLFADSIAQDPTHTQNIGNLKTLQDVIRYANNATEGGLTWQEAYFITTGQTPAERGITNATAAQADLHRWFNEHGIKAKPPTTSAAAMKNGTPNAAAKFTRKKEVQ